MATPEFILRLREKIGNDLLWLVGITAYVEDDEGRVLLGRRSDTREWALVYGINEPGEEPADTVIREVKEETGVDVVPTALVSVKAGKNITTYANGDRTQYLDLTFACRLAEGGCAAPRVGDDESLSTNELIAVICNVLGKKTRLLHIGKGVMTGLARIGGALHLPLNPERLQKLTENYVVSNHKIKQALSIDTLPVHAADGLRLTIESFVNNNK